MKDIELVPGVELLDSMRSMGYSFEAAVADLVDNSLAAGANQVEIECDPEARYILVADNGRGMSPDTAMSAMKLAGTAPTVVRKPDDLGRFGLGLKTASLSQGRRVTLITKQNNTVTSLCWDLDHVAEKGSWAVGVLSPAEFEALPGSQFLRDRKSGTVVLWEKLDFFLGEAKSPDRLVGERIKILDEHLSLIFHRFLSATGDKKLQIRANGRLLNAIDPFMERHIKTQESEIERIQILPGEFAEVTSFTLPHPSYFSIEERKRPDLGTRMREFQGIYVYRNKRLISFGHWFGISRREELTKQTRVRVDLPNSMDHLWQLDVRKSRAEPPQIFKHHLRRLIKELTDSSRRIHTHRGRNSKYLEKTVFVWNSIEERDGYRYEANQQHPVLRKFADSLDEPKKTEFSMILKLLADTFPVADLYPRVAANKEHMKVLDESAIEDLRRMLGIESVYSDGDGATKSVEPFEPVRNKKLRGNQ